MSTQLNSRELSNKKYQLSIERNLLSNQQIYLSSIKTTSIFAGLAILMLEKGSQNIKNCWFLWYCYYVFL